MENESAQAVPEQFVPWLGEDTRSFPEEFVPLVEQNIATAYEPPLQAEPSHPENSQKRPQGYDPAMSYDTVRPSSQVEQEDLGEWQWQSTGDVPSLCFCDLNREAYDAKGLTGASIIYDEGFEPIPPPNQEENPFKITDADSAYTGNLDLLFANFDANSLLLWSCP